MTELAERIQKGELMASEMLRRSHLYDCHDLAEWFREWGKIARTEFLLRYTADEWLQRRIQKACNETENWKCATKDSRTTGERPVVRETKRHEARTKAGLATGLAEAGRQRGTPDPCGPGTPTRTRRPNRKENPRGESHSRVDISPPAMGRMSAPSLVPDSEGSTPDRNLGMRFWGAPA